MATVRLKFRASSVPSAEGTLYYQVIHKRKIKCISTNHHVFPNEWDAQTATLLVPPDGERKQQLSLMRSAIAWELRLRRETIAKFEKADPDFSLDELCEAFAQLPAAMTVFTFLQEQVLRQERMHRQGTAKTYTRPSSASRNSVTIWTSPLMTSLPTSLKNTKPGLPIGI